MNTKLCVRDAEFAERAEQLRRGAERLRRVRARVREVIAADDKVRHAIDNAAIWDADKDLHLHCAPQEEGSSSQIRLM